MRERETDKMKNRIHEKREKDTHIERFRKIEREREKKKPHKEKNIFRERQRDVT